MFLLLMKLQVLLKLMCLLVRGISKMKELMQNSCHRNHKEKRLSLIISRGFNDRWLIGRLTLVYVLDTLCKIPVERYDNLIFQHV